MAGTNYPNVVAAAILLSPVQADIGVTALHHILFDTGVNPEQRSDWGMDGKSWLNTFIDTTTGSGTALVENNNIKVYPNPTTGLVTMWFENLLNAPVNMKVFDVSGKLVRSTFNQHSANKISVDLSGQLSGQYIVQLEIGKQVLTKKIELNQ